LGEHGFIVTGEYTMVKNVLEHIRRDPPDAVIVDGRRSQQNGVEEILAVKTEFPCQKLILLTTSQESKDILVMLKCKINGYLLKSSSPLQLVQDIKAVCQGETRISPELVGTIVNFVRNNDNFNKHSFDALTMREKEILNTIAKGKTNKEIAFELSISPNTVKNHVKSILSKLSIHSRSQAVSYWSGLVSTQRYNSQEENNKL